MVLRRYSGLKLYQLRQSALDASFQTKLHLETHRWK